MQGAALVLSGGGLLGVGWELGVLRGLQDGGVDLGRFERVIGTSAGAISGALLGSGAPLEALSGGPELDGQVASNRAPMSREAWSQVFAIFAAGGADQDRRAQIGAIALETTIPEDLYLDVRRQLVPDVPWPRALIVTAVDVADGAFASWGVDAGVPLLEAVAASTALPGMWPPVTIGGRRFMDGGLRSPTSADLASDSRVIVIVAATPHTEPIDRQLAAETAAVRVAGGEIVEVRPDAASEAAFGPDRMDGTRQPLVFEAGLRLGLAAAPEVAARMG